MAANINQFGGAMIQADSEMAAAHHVIGSALAGARSMTATSGPGFDLMQEAISASGITETPMVVVLCMRGGPGTGLPTRQGQEELNEAIFGSHGDIARIVLAASQPEDCFYIMEDVFNLAERYQCPVFLLLDLMLAQSDYTVPELDPSGFVIDRGKLQTTKQFRERYLVQHVGARRLRPDDERRRLAAARGRAGGKVEMAPKAVGAELRIPFVMLRDIGLHQAKAHALLLADGTPGQAQAARGEQ
jgi:pyruvate/2-oxoacid:ferredoxin oxidoreductase alpha subunit